MSRSHHIILFSAIAASPISSFTFSIAQHFGNVTHILVIQSPSYHICCWALLLQARFGYSSSLIHFRTTNSFGSFAVLCKQWLYPSFPFNSQAISTAIGHAACLRLIYRLRNVSYRLSSLLLYLPPTNSLSITALLILYLSLPH